MWSTPTKNGNISENKVVSISHLIRIAVTVQYSVQTINKSDYHMAFEIQRVEIPKDILKVGKIKHFIHIKHLSYTTDENSSL